MKFPRDWFNVEEVKLSSSNSKITASTNSAKQENRKHIHISTKEQNQKTANYFGTPFEKGKHFPRAEERMKNFG